ncbi:hypothetical protein BCR35DRAFT_349417 [Leucosporidium creatinivorum]|uniref:Uncharacterized protein n=1 Tax=Leucosporidium creatinivorum TaxID=106004 RepID=A0A1Y2G2N1_9BASI|nr:hypothetical protein BCR35DRAFT_349417 [Leucosporidium creatinivorum]
MNFFPFGRRTQTDPIPPRRPWTNPAFSASSSSFKDLGPSPAGHLNSPYHLGPFPEAEHEDNPQHLVSTFLAQAYPRAPTAVPPNQPWSTEVETLTTLVGAELVEGAHSTKHDIHGRILVARGEGIWLAGGESVHGVDDRGKRLFLALPSGAASATTLMAHGDALPSEFRSSSPNTCSALLHWPLLTTSLHAGTRWEYGCTLHSVKMDSTSPSSSISAPYVSIWRVLSLGLDEKPILVNHGDGPQPIGILVAFILNSSARAARRARMSSPSHLYRPPTSKGVTSAMVELVRSALTVLDADGAYPVGFKLRFLDAKRSRLEISGQGANVFNGGWIKSPEFHQSVRTVFYGLPEGSGHLKLAVPLGGGSGSSSSLARRGQGVLEFLPHKKVVSAHGLVSEVVWSVSPVVEAKLLPREFGNLEELYHESYAELEERYESAVLEIEHLHEMLKVSKADRQLSHSRWSVPSNFKYGHLSDYERHQKQLEAQYAAEQERLARQQGLFNYPYNTYQQPQRFPGSWFNAQVDPLLPPRRVHFDGTQHGSAGLFDGL